MFYLIQIMILTSCSNMFDRLITLSAEGWRVDSVSKLSTLVVRFLNAGVDCPISNGRLRFYRYFVTDLNGLQSETIRNRRNEI